ERSATDRLGDFGGEVLGLLLDPLAQAEAQEGVELHFTTEFLSDLAANLVDRARARLPDVLLTEERDFSVPLGDLALDDLRPHGLGRALLLLGGLQLEREVLLVEIVTACLELRDARIRVVELLLELREVDLLLLRDVGLLDLALVDDDRAHRSD